MRGPTFLIRYADDFVMGFAHEDDARRVMAVLPKRFGKYGLTLHLEKTRLVPFRRPPLRKSPRGGPGGDRPGTFDLLGFTHFWARSHKGNWVIKRKTSSSRFTRGLRMIYQWCRNHRHRSIAEQHAKLSEKLRGHYAYYGITGNSPALKRFREAVKHAWGQWLRRRRRKNRPSWNWVTRLQRRYVLPYAVALHSVCRPRRKMVT